MPEGQGHLFADEPDRDSRSQVRRAARRGTFVDNMKLPVHRWFRYSAGFSAEWAEQQIAALCGSDALVLDPFVGSGTTLLAAKRLGVASVGIEAHPFVASIAEIKLAQACTGAALREAGAVLRQLAEGHDQPETSDNSLLQRCYTPEAFGQLQALRRAWETQEEMPDALHKMLWLALTAILRECSGVGTAQWQYVLPNKSKKVVRSPFEAFSAKVALFAEDLDALSPSGSTPSTLITGDARTQQTKIQPGSVDVVLTSPPYPNNYDYADATRLEMTFWGDVERWGDLHDAVRQYLMRSCSQHTAKEKLVLDQLLADPGIDPIRAELTDVCTDLDRVRHTRGGKKTYHTMVAAYFVDLAAVWSQLRRVCKDGAQVCFVIGDAAPYGVYVPAEKWLGELAVANGFKDWSFDKIRDRNIKWKNRKHQVPLKEGYLWVQG